MHSSLISPSLLRKYVVVAVLLSASLHVMGQPWWCDCGVFYLWVGETLSHHTSQHVLDPYSFSHFQHGLIFFLCCYLIGNCSPWIPLIAEAGWELMENSSYIINRYRSGTIAFDYFGDSVINSLGDLTVCYLGFVVATRLRPRENVLLYLMIEIVMVLMYRDSLILNIIMLVHPIEGIKHWQQGG